MAPIAVFKDCIGPVSVHIKQYKYKQWLNCFEKLSRRNAKQISFYIIEHYGGPEPYSTVRAGFCKTLPKSLRLIILISIGNITKFHLAIFKL